MRKVSTLLGIIIIVAVALVLFGGVFAYQYYAKILNTENDNHPEVIGGDKDNHGCLIAAGYSWCEAKQKCLRVWEESCETDQTSGWKTYTNIEYGFEFKYPENWTISENGTVIAVWSSEKKKQEAKNAIIPIYPEFSVNYEDINSFKEFAKGLLGRDISGVKDFVSSYGYFGSYSETNFGGQKAYAVISVANRAVYTVYIEVGNNVFVLATEDSTPFNQSYDPKNPRIDEHVRQIISTFKFIP